MLKEWSMELEDAALKLAAACSANNRWKHEVKQFQTTNFARSKTRSGTFFFHGWPQNLLYICAPTKSVPFSFVTTWSDLTSLDNVVEG